MFTLDEARAALRAILAPLASLQRAQLRLREVRDELRVLGRQHLNDGVVAERRVRHLRAEQLRLAEKAQASVYAIRAAGAELKSIEDGLLDFPTVIDGVRAYWCWRSGEDEIEWWHPRSTGFAGRRRILPG
ncbi:MAG: DUF2203 family protein [Dehalococcoidia bacterium]|nr:DUF2203 family protein [Dehalococcoidia bacterium]